MNPIAIIAAVFALLFGIGWTSCSENVATPAGYVGYIRQGAIMGKAKFIGLQTGPTSSGRGWLYEVQNVCITPYTATESWTGNDILPAKDKLPMQFSANLIWKLKADKVKEFIELFGGFPDNASADEVSADAYKNFIEPQFRNICRDEVSKYNGLELNEHIGEINKSISVQLKAKLAGTPFEVIETVTGVCIPPAVVSEQIAMKVAKKQEDERKVTELSIAQKQLEIERALGQASAAKEVAEAEGKAKAIKEIRSAIDSTYLQYEAIKGISGAERIYVPTGSAGVPIVGSLNLEAKQ